MENSRFDNIKNFMEATSHNNKRIMVLLTLLLVFVVSITTTLAVALTSGNAINPAWGDRDGHEVTLQKFEIDEDGNLTTNPVRGARFALFAIHEAGACSAANMEAALVAGTCERVEIDEEIIFYTDEDGMIVVLLSPGDYVFLELEPPRGFTFATDDDDEEIYRWYFTVNSAGEVGLYVWSDYYEDYVFERFEDDIVIAFNVRTGYDLVVEKQVYVEIDGEDVNLTELTAEYRLLTDGSGFAGPGDGPGPGMTGGQADRIEFLRDIISQFDLMDFYFVAVFIDDEEVDHAVFVYEFDEDGELQLVGPANIITDTSIDGIVFTLRHNQRAVFTNLPLELEYHVRELPASGFITSTYCSPSGLIGHMLWPCRPDQDATVAQPDYNLALFRNTYVGSDDGELIVSKTVENLDGSPLTSAQLNQLFNFRVRFEGDALSRLYDAINEDYDADDYDDLEDSDSPEDELGPGIFGPPLPPHLMPNTPDTDDVNDTDTDDVSSGDYYTGETYAYIDATDDTTEVDTDDTYEASYVYDDADTEDNDEEEDIDDLDEDDDEYEDDEDEDLEDESDFFVFDDDCEIIGIGVIECTFTLQHGESRHFTNIPAGTRMTVTEENIPYGYVPNIITTVRYMRPNHVEIVEFTNYYGDDEGYGNIVIDKTVLVNDDQGQVVDPDQMFEFTLVLTSIPENLNYEGEDEGFRVYFNDDTEYTIIVGPVHTETFQLAHGEEFRITGLPHGVRYDIREAYVSGFIQGTYREIGTIIRNEPAYVRFFNEMERETEYTDLTVCKTIINEDPDFPSDSFFYFFVRWNVGRPDEGVYENNPIRLRSDECYTIENLPSGADFQVLEPRAYMDDRYVLISSPGTTGTLRPGQPDALFVNRDLYIDIPVEKLWDYMLNGVAVALPSSITVRLWEEDRVPHVDEMVLEPDADGNWRGVFTAPRYRGDTEINYTVDEVPIPGWLDSQEWVCTIIDTDSGGNGDNGAGDNGDNGYDDDNGDNGYDDDNGYGDNGDNGYDDNGYDYGDNGYNDTEGYHLSVSPSDESRVRYDCRWVITNEATELPRIIIPVRKAITGATPTVPQQFEFLLRAETSGAPMPEVSSVFINGTGTVSFPPITFTAPGVFEYTVREFIPTNEGAYVFDRTIFRIVVTVVEDEYGALTATHAVHRGTITVPLPGGLVDILFTNHYNGTPVPPTPPTPTPPTEPPVQSRPPQTGDDTPLGLWMMLTALSGVSLVLYTLRSYVKHRDEYL